MKVWVEAVCCALLVNYIVPSLICFCPAQHRKPSLPTFQDSVQDSVSNETLDNLKFHQKLAAAVYCNQKNLIHWKCIERCEPGIHFIKMFHGFRNHVTGYVALRSSDGNNNDEIIVVFRGSRSLSPRNWSVNLSVKQVPLISTTSSSNIMVHNGYQSSYQLIASTVLIINQASRYYHSINFSLPKRAILLLRS